MNAWSRPPIGKFGICAHRQSALAGEDCNGRILNSGSCQFSNRRSRSCWRETPPQVKDLASLRDLHQTDAIDDHVPFFHRLWSMGKARYGADQIHQGILESTAIDIYNHGEMYRDFTCVDDLVRGLRLLMDVVPVRPVSRDEIEAGDNISPVAPYRVVNIGNSEKVLLLDYIDAIEAELGIKAERNYMDMQLGDLPATWANADPLNQMTGYVPQTDYRVWIARFVKWYRDYYKI